MDVFSFLNSRDIRAHLKSIGYTFSPTEAAWVIHASRSVTLAQKHAAWLELTETVPDCKIQSASSRCQGESLHLFLQRYMAMQNRWLKQFSDASGAVYRLRIVSPKLINFSSVYSSVETARAGLADFQTQDASLKGVSYMISRQPLDRNGLSSIEVVFNSEDAPMCIWNGDLSAEEQELAGIFFSLWFDFPHPFKAGDLLHFPKAALGNEFPTVGPFVATQFNRGGFEDNWNDDELRELGGEYDMIVRGYAKPENGEICELVHGSYMDCEFYRRDLIGTERVLYVLQDYLRGKLCLEELVNQYHRILTIGEASPQ